MHETNVGKRILEIAVAFRSSDLHSIRISLRHSSISDFEFDFYK